MLMIADDEVVDLLKRCMLLLLNFQARRKVAEIWIGPFLHEMNDAFPRMNNAERKALLGRMADIGAIEILQRPRDSEEGGTYAIARINWKHPLVLEINPG